MKKGIMFLAALMVAGVVTLFAAQQQGCPESGCCKAKTECACVDKGVCAEKKCETACCVQPGKCQVACAEGTCCDKCTSGACCETAAGKKCGQMMANTTKGCCKK